MDPLKSVWTGQFNGGLLGACHTANVTGTEEEGPKDMIAYMFLNKIISCQAGKRASERESSPP